MDYLDPRINRALTTSAKVRQLLDQFDRVVTARAATGELEGVLRTLTRIHYDLANTWNARLAAIEVPAEDNAAPPKGTKGSTKAATSAHWRPRNGERELE